MKQRLFQYAVLWHPNEDEAKAGQKSKIVSEMATILATDEKSVAILAAKKIPDEYNDSLNQVEVLVRPF